MATNFWTSTHCCKWLFERKELDKQRDVHRGPFDDALVAHIHGFFARLILALGRKMGWRQTVIATAVLFFKRFYVKSSFSEYDPRLVVPTALYLAAKVEEMGQIRAELVIENLWRILGMYGPAPRFTAQQVYAYEFHLLQSLEFDLVVFHPYRSLLKYVEDSEAGDDCCQTAWTVVNDSLRTDACLRFPPHIIAIAALYVAKLYHNQDARSWFGKLNVNLDEVREVVREVMALYKQDCTLDEDDFYSKIAIVTKKLDEIFASQYNYPVAHTGSKRPASVLSPGLSLTPGSSKRQRTTK